MKRIIKWILLLLVLFLVFVLAGPTPILGQGGMGKPNPSQEMQE